MISFLVFICFHCCNRLELIINPIFNRDIRHSVRWFLGKSLEDWDVPECPNFMQLRKGTWVFAVTFTWKVFGIQVYQKNLSKFTIFFFYTVWRSYYTVIQVIRAPHYRGSILIGFAVFLRTNLGATVSICLCPCPGFRDTTHGNTSREPTPSPNH